MHPVIPWLLASLAAPAAWPGGPQGLPAASQVVVAGRITGYNGIAPSFELTIRDAADPGDIGAGGIRIGVGVGGRRPGDISPTATDPSRRPADSGVRSASPTRIMVAFTEATVCREGRTPFPCRDLRIQDRVRVAGEEAVVLGHPGLTAAEIVRTP